MQTIQQYADAVAVGDQGRWGVATRSGAELIGYPHATVYLSRRIR